MLFPRGFRVLLSFFTTVAICVDMTKGIIHGRSATKGQFPWACALYLNGHFTCTCSILNSKTVLTAATCLYIDDVIHSAEQFYAIANYNRSSKFLRIDFAAVKVHPDYNSSNIDNDIALMETTEPIAFNDDVKPICIPRPDTPMNEYTKATAMGWGNTDRNSYTYPKILHYTGQRIVANQLCKIYGKGISDEIICAQGVFNSICIGDNGGPLVAEATKPDSNETRMVEIGITSYINAIAGCGTVTPSVWTRVSSYYDYIMKNAADSDQICTG